MDIHSSRFAYRIFHEEKPLNPEFPSEVPTKVVKPSLPPGQEKLPFKQVKQLSEQGIKEELLRLNPPTPCYRSLKNNVPTPLLKYKDLDWPKDTVSATEYITLCV